ncbi:PemK-like, MazF-like toxin of type II toxin-antitoxin system [Stackebrandtia endophytica]|uniref:PemK-like, MazF-like toxin of type II toxin-antitoxin system n=1 Tax=Stackebrandtia endophytica TaxID=1496996 RepID=A0A543AYS3_9ACTN|nr:type II toxin-antitoxin system PemK/MazF family toxin [Stackebrandtia endophytica]TQL77726.1 PemK-like, MazF-like toxin of type II toxin-antitoxin system [Stackebrandtia endophytica]
MVLFIWLAAVVIVGALAFGLIKLLTAGRGGHTVPAPPGGPQPSEIWWAEVPFADGSGAKHRPCLVLWFDGTGRYTVLAITSQDQSGRSDAVAIPTRHWDRKAKRDSFLKLQPRLRIHRGGFDRVAGRVDAGTWQLVRRRHRF